MAARHRANPIAQMKRALSGRLEAKPAKAVRELGGHPEEADGNLYLRLYRSGGKLKRATVRYILYGLGAWVLFLILFGDTGAVRLYRLEREKAELEERKRLYEASVERLQRDVTRLRNDPGAIEKVAREKYGYKFEGEEILRIVRPGERSWRLE